MQIPYGRQQITQDDIDAVVATLKSDFITQGPAVAAFEKAVSEVCGDTHAVAMNSATSALHVACMALGVKEGSLVWTVPNSFVASANCALYCGAEVDFIDIHPETYNMDMQALAEKLAAAPKKPDVVIPVHFSGQSCDMKALDALRKQYGFKVIEDASHAIGARYDGAPVGDCRYSDICIFSFHPVKIITTAEGGMAMTRSQELYQSMLLLRSHGITRNPAELSEQHGPWYYEQVTLGYNYRITDLQCALGTSQMQRLDQFIKRRREIAARYDRLLAGHPEIITPAQLDGQESAWHLYVVLVPAAKRLAVFQQLRAAGIGVNVHYIPIHTQPHYRSLGFDWGMFPVSEAYYHSVISIPVFADLTDAEQDYVVAQLTAALGEAKAA